MDCHARGLVDHEKRIVFVQHVSGEARRSWRARDGSGRANGASDRRQAEPVAGRQTVLGPHAGAIHPHFAAPQYPVDVAFRNAFQEPNQIVVDPLGRPFFPNFMPRCGIFT
jgi:hypothetical protein